MVTWTLFFCLFQYPGVAQSINSDVNNLMTVLNMSNALPEGNRANNFNELTPNLARMDPLTVLQLRHFAQFFSILLIICETSLTFCLVRVCLGL